MHVSSSSPRIGVASTPIYSNHNKPTNHRRIVLHSLCTYPILFNVPHNTTLSVQHPPTPLRTPHRRDPQTPQHPRKRGVESFTRGRSRDVYGLPRGPLSKLSKFGFVVKQIPGKADLELPPRGRGTRRLFVHAPIEPRVEQRSSVLGSSFFSLSPRLACLVGSSQENTDTERTAAEGGHRGARLTKP